MLDVEKYRRLEREQEETRQAFIKEKGIWNKRARVVYELYDNIREIYRDPYNNFIMVELDDENVKIINREFDGYIKEQISIPISVFTAENYIDECKSYLIEMHTQSIKKAMEKKVAKELEEYNRLKSIYGDNNEA